MSCTREEIRTLLITYLTYLEIYIVHYTRPRRGLVGSLGISGDWPLISSGTLGPHNLKVKDLLKILTKNELRTSSGTFFFLIPILVTQIQILVTQIQILVTNIRILVTNFRILVTKNQILVTQILKFSIWSPIFRFSSPIFKFSSPIFAIIFLIVNIIATMKLGSYYSSEGTQSEG